MDEKLLDQLLKMTIPQGGRWLPEGAASGTLNVDSNFWFIFYPSVLTFLLVVVPLAFFMVRYRRHSATQAAESQGQRSILIEVVATLVPLLFVGVVFLMGMKTFTEQNVAPDNAIHIQVQGQQWFWKMTYLEDSQGKRLKEPVVMGKEAGQEFLLPRGVPVKLTVSSVDVLHGFFVPNFRVKVDAVPGRNTTLWLKATAEGEYPILCSQYCGTNHSQMLAHFKVVSPKEFDKKIKGASGPSKATVAHGKKLFAQSCSACHSLTGTRGVGPSFKGLFGRHEQLEGGGTVTVDNAYIIESLNEPNKKIVKGFAPAMPPLGATLSDIDKDSIIMFIKTVN